MSDVEAIEILLVEDDPQDAELALRALRQAKIANHIRVARDGAEAIEILFGDESSNREATPKVILLDLKLPKVDGLEVIQRVKSDPRTKLIPIVVLTSSREQNDIVESYRLGVNSYIVKPVDFERFAEAVQKAGLYWLLLNQSPPADKL
jgi:two-component system response regulator